MDGVPEGHGPAWAFMYLELYLVSVLTRHGAGSKVRTEVIIACQKCTATPVPVCIHQRHCLAWAEECSAVY